MNKSILISSYSYFCNLAHKPNSNQNLIPLKIINNNISKCITIKDCYNPAFVLKHPTKNIIYICCESIFEGHIFTITYDSNFNFSLLNKVETGKSACYIVFDFEIKNLIVVNYWDSTLKIHPLINDIAQDSIYTVKSKNKYNNRVNHLKNRQNESHNHSILLYKFNKKTIAFVPDLGKDLIKIFNYDVDNKIPLKLISKYKMPKGSGPRYIRNINNFLYVINELNSTVQVLKIKTNMFNNIYLSSIQIISTIPSNFTEKNTCGNIEIHPSKRYLFASNRGHNSIAFYKILDNNQLRLIDIVSSMGDTPRHFIINKKGNLIYIANQDSNNICCFNFVDESMTYNNITKVNSPNFLIEL